MGSHSTKFRAKTINRSGSVTNWENTTDSSNSSYGTLTGLIPELYVGDWGASVPADATITKMRLNGKIRMSVGKCKLSTVRDTPGNTLVTKNTTLTSTTGSDVTINYPSSSGGTNNATNFGKVWKPSNLNYSPVFLITFTVAASSVTPIRVYYFDLIVDYTLPDYTITTTYSGEGSVKGSGTYESGKSVTIKAEPAPNYRFVQWSDGNTSPERTIKVSGNATYTAKFEPIHVTSLDLSHSELNIKMSDKVELVHDYISTLNFKGLGCGTPNCVSEIKPNYLMLRSTANDAYVGSYGMSSPISDTAKMYVFDIDPNSKYTYIVNAKVPEGAQYSIFVFYYDSSYNYIDHDAQSNKTLGQTIINDSNPWSKQIPANAKYASIRVDNDISGYEIYYTNVLVYKGNFDSIYNSAAIAEIIKPDDALNKVVMWSSSNPDVVTINEDTGILTAKSAGAAVITCQSRDGSFTAYCTVNVTGEGITNIYLGDVPITSVYLGNLPLTLYLGSFLL